ncbi:phospholipid/cholesterol/gamma-HCH transport system ATP-binding protein [Selenomonas ruminantium]|uniref:Phospholipid/cholesterol/gamma-HCH transport system ATP-binding protein n=1 Tax=Selenomonas ruminantium TaxID=971 RepID=A0A1M6TRR3_SELRU|nr:ABC transporter ATP-binding protein [Selenomonas ruminantium]SHK59675.1 phospholipid/cholesterol/gamma-HCH transport system ATP-binding protein [Selenomonas ruminantium]
MIRLSHVSKIYDGNYALHDINMEIKTGETLAIIGGSGSGKSTLLQLLVGLIRPDEGEIYIGEREISRLSEKEMDKVRLHMGMVFQYSALFDSMTVGENVAFGLREHRHLPEKEIRRIVREKLELVGLPGVEAKMPGELSGGMKKRVSLARAIAIEPETIFYDEPSSGLDPLTTAKIDELIVDMQRKLGVTSVVVTHDMASACRIADRIAMVYEGELIAVDTVERFQQIQDERVQAFFRTLHTRKAKKEEQRA